MSNKKQEELPKRSRCEVCGDFKTLNDDYICYDCEQDAYDLQDEEDNQEGD